MSKERFDFSSAFSSLWDYLCFQRGKVEQLLQGIHSQQATCFENSSKHDSPRVCEFQTSSWVLLIMKRNWQLRPSCPDTESTSLFHEEKTSPKSCQCPKGERADWASEMVSGMGESRIESGKVRDLALSWLKKNNQLLMLSKVWSNPSTSHAIYFLSIHTLARYTLLNENINVEAGCATEHEERIISVEVERYASSSARLRQ